MPMINTKKLNRKHAPYSGNVKLMFFKFIMHACMYALFNTGDLQIKSYLGIIFIFTPDNLTLFRSSSILMK